MKQFLSHRPSPSMVVALAALVVATSGTAIAATQLVKGDKLIAKGSLSGNRLKKHSVTGLQVNLGKLGKVPTARKSDTATLATNATNATNAAHATTATSATNATNATNASTLAGQAPGAFDAASNFVRTGIMTNSIGQTTTLAAFGPFTVTLKCTDAGGGTPQAEIDETSTDSNSFQDATALSSTPTQLAGSIVSNTTYSENANFPDFLASTGKAWVTTMLDGVKYLGKDCFASALVLQS